MVINFTLCVTLFQILIIATNSFRYKVGSKVVWKIFQFLVHQWTGAFLFLMTISRLYMFGLMLYWGKVLLFTLTCVLSLITCWMIMYAFFFVVTYLLQKLESINYLVSAMFSVWLIFIIDQLYISSISRKGATRFTNCCLFWLASFTTFDWQGFTTFSALDVYPQVYQKPWSQSEIRNEIVIANKIPYLIQFTCFHFFPISILLGCFCFTVEMLF